MQLITDLLFGSFVLLTLHSPSQERLALAVLFYSTVGDQWTSNTGWLTATHHGNWFGVTIDSSTNYVRRLSLRDNALRGTIPEQIGELTSLAIFSIQNNALSGTIPAQIGELTSLTDLYLHNNALGGTIPTQIQDLISLTYLYLNQNALTGPIPNGVCDLPAYLWADCGNCNLSKPGCCNSFCATPNPTPNPTPYPTPNPTPNRGRCREKECP